MNDATKQRIKSTLIEVAFIVTTLTALALYAGFFYLRFTCIH